jgi:hypothetical protein
MHHVEGSFAGLFAALESKEAFQILRDVRTSDGKGGAERRISAAALKSIVNLLAPATMRPTLAAMCVRATKKRDKRD